MRTAATKSLNLNRWDVTPAEARAIQQELRGRVELRDRIVRIRYVAGADVSFRLPEPRSWERGSGRAIAGVVLFRYPSLEEVERVWIEEALTFPYVPGLLSFREIPALLSAFAKLSVRPDLVFVDGHGYSHPRRVGIASHLGLVLDTPTIGCAKSVLIGKYAEPGSAVGSWTPLLAAASQPDMPIATRAKTGPPLGIRAERVAAALRTRAGVRPIFVSTGHRVSLPRAIEVVLSVCDGFRIPKPTRTADHFVKALKREESATLKTAANA